MKVCQATLLDYFLPHPPDGLDVLYEENKQVSNYDITKRARLPPTFVVINLHLINFSSFRCPSQLGYICIYIVMYRNGPNPVVIRQYLILVRLLYIMERSKAHPYLFFF